MEMRPDALVNRTVATVRKARDWITIVRWPYAAFVASLVLTLVAAGMRQPTLARVALVVLVLTAVRLDQVVRDDRRGPVDHCRERLAFAAVQLVVGVVLGALGWLFSGAGLDGFFFLGVALTLMSLAAIVSELRKSEFNQQVLGPLFLVTSVGLLFIAFLFGGWVFATIVVVALVVFGEVGAEFVSEASHTSSVRPHPRIVTAAGLALLFIGFGLLVTTGAEPAHALPLVLVLGFLAWMTSSDSDGLVIVVIVAVALAWAAAPKGVEPDEELEPVRGEPYFAVLGDSYISGEGASRFLEGTNRLTGDDPDHTKECRQAPTAWGFRLAKVAPAGIPGRVLFLGCSGAITENIHTEARLDAEGRQHGPRELQQLVDARTRLGRDPEFVVLSIGGNDAGFGQIGETCVGPGNCAEVAQQFLHALDRKAPTDQPIAGPPGKGEVEALAYIADDLDAAYTRARAAAGDAPVIAVPYPVPLTAAGRCPGALLDRDERRFVAGFVRELNRVIKSAAERNGLLYMDTMQGALQRHGRQLCAKANGRSGLNFFALNPKAGSLRDSLLPTNWLHNSLHPNADGHDALYEEAAEWLRANPPPAGPLEPKPGAPHAVRTVDEVIGGAPVEQCDPADRVSCSVNKRRWLVDQLVASYGLALAPVVVTLAGAWLVLAPIMWRGRNGNWSLATLAITIWRKLRRRSA